MILYEIEIIVYFIGFPAKIHSTFFWCVVLGVLLVCHNIGFSLDLLEMIQNPENLGHLDSEMYPYMIDSQVFAISI